MPRPKKTTTSPCFKPGDKVRVKRGVIDPDFPDIPLGGWSGSVKEVEQVRGQTTYLIEWDRRTLQSIHLVYRKRCERDELEFETMWLREEEIEPDEGERVPIEQPAAIVTRPLSVQDPEDRIRLALGLSHDDPLPKVSRKTLRAYHRYLAERLTFPFPATTWDFGRLNDQLVSVTIHGLLAPEEVGLDKKNGLICTGLDRDGLIEIPLAEVKRKAPNYHLVSDYATDSTIVADGYETLLPTHADHLDPRPLVAGDAAWAAIRSCICAWNA
jgi:hypothetical protein